MLDVLSVPNYSHDDCLDGLRDCDRLWCVIQLLLLLLLLLGASCVCVGVSVCNYEEVILGIHMLSTGSSPLLQSLQPSTRSRVHSSLARSLCNAFANTCFLSQVHRHCLRAVWIRGNDIFLAVYGTL